MGTDQNTSPRWMRLTLAAAAVYNIGWATWAGLFPNAWFELGGMVPPRYPAVWQCVAMLVGTYGVGYAIAARDPLRWWPLVLIGLIGKVLGPIGFVIGAARGELAWSLGWTIITNDLVWWVPFTLIVWSGWKASMRPRGQTDVALPLAEALRGAVTQGGENLFDLSQQSRLLVVCLRHSGCTFCRQALADLQKRRSEIEAAGARIVLVHMSADADAAAKFKSYGLDDVPRVSDPSRRLYQSLGLERGRFAQVAGPRVWWRGFKSVILERHGFGRVKEDVFQMPGAFVIHSGKIERAYRHETSADQPDFCELVLPTAHATNAM